MTHAIMTILDDYVLMKESLKTMVSLEALNGIWLLCESNALMHSLRARRLLLISAPSSLLTLLFDWQSAALSEPAKSTNNNFPEILPAFLMIS